MTSAIERFASQIRSVSYSVFEAFDGAAELEDITQEAYILAARYSGEMAGWHSGKLEQWERLTTTGEHGVKALFVTTLRADLNQVIGRQIEDSQQTESLDHLQESGFDAPAEAAEDREAELRERYPTLCLQVLDGYNELEIARKLKVTDRTVRNYLAADKARFLRDNPVRRRLGLRCAFGSEGCAGVGSKPTVDTSMPALYISPDTYHGQYALTPHIKEMLNGICDEDLLNGKIGERVL